MSTPAEFDIDPVIVPACVTSKKNHDSFGVLPKHPIFVGIEPIAVPPVVFAGNGGILPQICLAALHVAPCAKKLLLIPNTNSIIITYILFMSIIYESIKTIY